MTMSTRLENSKNLISNSIPQADKHLNEFNLLTSIRLNDKLFSNRNRHRSASSWSL